MLKKIAKDRLDRIVSSVIAKGKDSYRNYLDLGPDELYTLCEGDMLDNPEPAMKAALAKYPYYEKFYSLYIDNLMGNGQVPKAVKVSSDFLKRFRAGVEANRKRAEVLVASGEPAEGLRYFDYASLLIRTAVLSGKYRMDPDDGSVDFCDIEEDERVLVPSSGKSSREIINAAMMDFIYEMIFATSIPDDESTFSYLLFIKQELEEEK